MADEMSELERAALGRVLAIAEAIQELGQVPSGHLYAGVAGHMSLDNFERIIAILVRTKQVEQKNHLLTWIGAPKP